jgi:hypothetical protein
VTSPFFLSRRSVLGALAGGLMAGSARAQSKPGAEIDLSRVTLRVALPIEDILDQFAHRSADFSLVGVTPDIPETHQKVADTFLKLGVPDTQVDVAKFWDTSFSETLAIPHL